MVGFVGPALSVAAGLLTSFMGNRRADKAAAADRVNTVRDRENMFSDLRAAAVKGGFNPLTALSATGGAGFGSGSSSSGVSGSPPPLASIQAITTGLTGVGDILSGQAARDQAAQEANTDLMRAQTLRLQNPEVQQAYQTVSNTRVSVPRMSSGPPESPDPAFQFEGEIPPMGQTRPKAASIFNAGMTAVFAPDGRRIKIPTLAARRLKVESGDMLTIGDYEEVLGDLGGTVSGAPMLPAATQVFDGGYSFETGVEDRQEVVDAPWSPGSWTVDHTQEKRDLRETLQRQRAQEYLSSPVRQSQPSLRSLPHQPRLEMDDFLESLN